MKRRFSIAFGFVLLAGGLSAALPAHAQFVSQNADGSYTVDTAALQQATDQANQNLIQQTDQAASNVANSAANEATAGLAPDSAAATAARNNPGGLDMQGDSGYDSIMTWIMRLFAWLMGVAAVTLDFAAYYTVVHMGSLMSSSSSGLAAIGVAWRILRDIGNIILLFGFLAIGIATILNAQTYGARKMLPMLLISAVMLNFSLFIAEAVIDVGNLFATEFFVQINNGQEITPAQLTAPNAVHNEGISNRIMSQLGLSTIYNTTKNQDLLKSGNLWIVGFMAVILFLIASFVMFSLAFILISRFVFLIFLIIVAPVGIAGLAIPKLDKYAGMWWNKLFEQTITAPVLMLMLYVALAVITDVNFLTGFGISGSSQQSSAWLAFMNNGNGDLGAFAGMILAFLVAMGLLLAVTMLAKSMSAFGASAATKWGTRLSGIGLVAAGAGMMGRNTAGALGYRASKKIRNSALGRTAIGRGFADSIEKNVAKNSFDFRNAKFAGTAAKSVGLQLGKGQKGGFKKSYEASVKAYEQGARDSITDRKKTREEEAAIKNAEALRDAAAQLKLAAQSHRDEAQGAHAAQQAAAAQIKVAAQNERDEAKRMHDDNQANLEQLKAAKAADRYWEADPENRRKLEEADKSVIASEQALAAADTKLAATHAEADKSLAASGQALAAANVGLATARTEETRTRTTATKIKSDIETGIKNDTKGRREEYANKLEKGWARYARGYVAGGSLREAAANIRKNAGKSKDEIENEKLLKQLRKTAEKTNKEEAEGEEKKEAKEEKNEH